MMFMTKYSEEIKEVQRHLKEQNDESGGRSAWNEATTILIARYQKDHPEVYPALQGLAAEMRATGGLDFVEQDPAVVTE